MNTASVSVSTATITQQIQTKEPVLAQSVSAYELGRVGDTVEVSPGRSARIQRDNAVKTVTMQAEMLRRMAERIIKEQYAQGNHLYMLLYGGKAVQLDPSLRPETFHPEYIPAQHQQAVANAFEYFSSAHTAVRIINAAEDIAGADVIKNTPVMVDVFRAAVGTAFVNVQSETGGVLPPMMQQTYEYTMQNFDALKKVEAAG